MSMRLLSGLLKKFVEKGRLTVIDVAGQRTLSAAASMVPR